MIKDHEHAGNGETASSLDRHNLIALLFIPKMRYFKQYEFIHSGLKCILKHRLNKKHNYPHECTEVNRPVRCFMTSLTQLLTYC